MTPQPLVTILIDNYNYGRFLRQAIDSALAQVYGRIEVIVVDDGSTDDSHAIIRSYGSQIHGILKPNGGQASAFNAGVAASQGEILCLLDADDVFLPHKVTQIVAEFERDFRLGWIFDPVREFDNATGQPLHCERKWRTGEWDMRAVTRAGSPPYIPTASSGLSFRRWLLDKIFPMPELPRTRSDGSSITGIELSDAYIKWVALAESVGWMSDEELTLMRIHNANVYTRRKKDKLRLSGQIELLTGICLYEKWPTLRKLGIKVFSRGLAAIRSNGGLDPDLRLRVDRFMSSLPLRSRAEALARTAAWRVVGAG
jgi:CTP:molybdopterin cytidylyltransferase MocA